MAMIEAQTRSLANDQMVDIYGTYGCNMTFRLKPIRSNAILFDENLPLYGWQEDIDFSLRVGPYGRIVKSERCAAFTWDSNPGERRASASAIRRLPIRSISFARERCRGSMQKC